jgi:geranylgeranyl pyrophosphate synthase
VADDTPKPRAPRLLTDEELIDVRLGFRYLLPTPGTLEPGLRAALVDLVEHPGSLARAQLAYGVLRDCDMAVEPARRLAVAVEYFHTASLVFDDMPSMDDATERRGRPCSHVAHGEANATLAALALINRAYALLWQVLATLPPSAAAAAGALVTECLGAEGILDGQARDLRFGARSRQPRPVAVDDDPAREVLRVAEGKTVPLVRLALVLPAMAAGVGAPGLEHLERLSAAWGLAYQILDDFKDGLMSREETGKSTARDGLLGRPNLPSAVGRGNAMARLEALLADGRSALDALETLDDTARFAHSRLGALQGFLEGERARIAARLNDERTRRPPRAEDLPSDR